MARPIYSAQFIAGTAASTYVLTNPGPNTWVFKELDVWVGVTGVPLLVTFKGIGGEVVWAASSGAPGDTYLSWRGRHVAGPGQSITVSAASLFDCSLAGFALVP